MIKLDDNQISIMGRPNFSCAKMSKLLIRAGVYEDKARKAEYEQAVFIHWALDLREKWGDDWAAKGVEALQVCVDVVRKAQADRVAE